MEIRRTTIKAWGGTRIKSRVGASSKHLKAIKRKFCGNLNI